MAYKNLAVDQVCRNLPCRLQAGARSSFSSPHCRSRMPLRIPSSSSCMYSMEEEEGRSSISR